jgi:hypothetical protein
LGSINFHSYCYTDVEGFLARSHSKRMFTVSVKLVPAA